ncbi:MAG: substrate-binding domain-containing protein [Anaerolineaceae bacterium]|nr:substrate-binding domain-containing protein [Anaerolineaceae bacterium]
MFNHRQQQIVNLLKEYGFMSVNDLAEKLDVSGATIRNDLRRLNHESMVERFHGGAMINQEAETQSSQPTCSLPENHHLESMARWAADLLHDDDAIFIDESLEAQYLIPHLQQHKNLKIFTNSLVAAAVLSQNPVNEVYLIGGRVLSDGKQVIGNMGLDLMDKMHIRVAFISPDGFSFTAGLTQNSIEAAEAKASYVDRASMIVVLLQSNKIGSDKISSFASIESIRYFVTDEKISETDIEVFHEFDTNLVVCGGQAFKFYGKSGKNDKDIASIGFANLDDRLPFSKDVRRSLEEHAKKNNLNLVMVDNQLEVTTALNAADYLIKAGVQVAIEYQIFETLGGALMNKYRAAKIPVIAVDIPIVGATFFGVDNYNAGFMAGEAMGKWLNANWQGKPDCILVLEEKRTGAVVATRIYGQLEGLRSQIGEIDETSVIRIDCGNLPSISEENVSQFLDLHPQWKHVAIICHNDDAAYGAICAARKKERENHVAIVGQGADRLIRSEIQNPASRIIGSTAYWPERYGEELIKLARKILKGEQLPPAIHMQHVFIDHTNIHDYYSNENIISNLPNQ